MRQRLGDLPDRLMDAAVQRFMDTRGFKDELDKAPSTGELIVWTEVLQRAGVYLDALGCMKLPDLPHRGTLICPNVPV